MKKVFLSPGKFVLGKNELYQLGEYIGQFGSHALLIAHPEDSARVADVLKATCQTYNINLVDSGFGGECTYEEVARSALLLEQHPISCVVGLGGGKALDTAKCLADKQNLPMISVPTIASTDAPCSSMAVIYDQDHGYVENYYMKRSPAVVLVDSQIIANAPERFLIAGIGDAYATYFEAQICAQTGALNYGKGAGTFAAMELARLCRNILVEHGEQAVWACKRNLVVPSLEAVIEANILLSGLGFESMGLAAAHCIPTILYELGAVNAMHGEHVAFGLLVQFVMEGRPMEDIRQTLEFYRRVGLPVCLADLGITGPIPDALWERAAKFACTPTSTMRNMPMTVTEDMVKPAILMADALHTQLEL